MTVHETTALNASLLWDYVSVNNEPFRCHTRAALDLSDAQIRNYIRYLRDEVGLDVILPGGMEPEPHADPEGFECRCGRLALNYEAGDAKAWYERRLGILLGHAREVEATGTRLHEQFPRTAIMGRLKNDAVRLREDVEMALAWLAS